MTQAEREAEVAFYKLTVQQRDAAWLEIERLKAENAALHHDLEAERLEVDFLKDTETKRSHSDMLDAYRNACWVAAMAAYGKQLDAHDTKSSMKKRRELELALWAGANAAGPAAECADAMFQVHEKDREIVYKARDDMRAERDAALAEVERLKSRFVYKIGERDE